MADTYWQKQAPDKPLYADILWSRPENKRSAGKLLIVGGNLHGVAAVSQAYTDTMAAGIGTARTILPDSLSKTLGRIFPEAEFAPTTPSGSFTRSSLAQLLENAAWADGTLLAGDFGKNSETAILLESFVSKYNGPLTATGDSLDYFLRDQYITTRPSTQLVMEFPQIQKLMAAAGHAVKSSMDLTRLVGALHVWTTDIEASICTIFSDQIIFAHKGRLGTMSIQSDLSKVAAHASVWQVWQPAKPFESLASAVYDGIHK